MKLLPKILLILLVVVLAVPAYLVLRLDSVLHSAIVNNGPDILGAPVELAGIDVGLLDGTISVDGLVIGNPQGFTSPHAVSIGHFNASVEPASLFSDVVRIGEIVIERPDMIWETSKAGSNLSAIQANLAPDPDEAATSSDVRVQIKKFVISEAVVTVAGLPLAKDTSVKLPDVQILNIGMDENGVTVAEASQQVMDNLMPTVTRALANANIKGLTADLLGQDGVSPEGLKDKAEEKLKKGLGKLLGGDKDQ